MTFYEKFKDEVRSIQRKIIDYQYWNPILPMYNGNHYSDDYSKKYDFRISGNVETRNSDELFFTFGSGHLVYTGSDKVLYYHYKDMKLNLDELTEEEYFQNSTVYDIGETTFKELIHIKEMYHSLQKLVTPHCKLSLENYNIMMENISKSCKQILSKYGAGEQ